MAVKFKVRRDDEVVVISGKDKGVKGKILKVLPKEGRVVVSGVNVVRRHMKPSSANPEGGIVEKEKSIDVSNIQLVDPKTGKPTRVGYKVENGSKVRIAKASGEAIDK